MNTSVDDLLTADSHLTRSFVAAVAGALAVMAWAVFAGSGPSWTLAVLVLAQFGCYVWYAFAAGESAKTLGDKGWPYVAWILAAPFVALAPIPVVSTVIAVSPLVIKFLLGSQLQNAIHEQTLEVLHPTH
jgi:hypothetical protein